MKNTKTYISELVKQELDLIEEESLKKKMFNLIENFEVLKLTEEVKKLADEYMQEHIVPEKFKNDAVHIAIATIESVNSLVSWNFKHLVNVKTRQMVNLVNLKKGYKPIETIAPPEL